MLVPKLIVSIVEVTLLIAQVLKGNSVITNEGKRAAHPGQIVHVLNLRNKKMGFPLDHSCFHQRNSQFCICEQNTISVSVVFYICNNMNYWQSYYRLHKDITRVLVQRMTVFVDSIYIISKALLCDACNNPS